jgi:uncharacterized protein YcfJ
MDPTREEQVMKRAAVVLGIAAALAVPATASAGNSIQAKPQLKPQVSKVMVANPARQTVARATSARQTTLAHRSNLKRMAR